jgi:sugar lactone lactonase YvrE/cytochrome c553
MHRGTDQRIARAVRALARSSAVRLAACLSLPLLVGLGGTCTPPGGDPFGGEDSDLLTQRAIAGLEFFSAQGCAACHCNDAVGGCNLDAPGLRGAARAKIDAMLRGGQAASPHPMKLDASEDDVQNLAVFFESLAHSTSLNGDSQVTLGYNLYVSGGCIVCHLASAQGVNQGGVGLPIAGTNPDNIYAALSGAVPCHPRQRVVPEDVRADCRFGIDTNDTIQALTDTPPPDVDRERVLLSYFLNFIAPPPSSGFVEPCQQRPGTICTIAGNGVSGYTGDGTSADKTLLYSPLQLELTDWNLDGVLDLGVVDWNNHRVRIIYLDVEIGGVRNRIESIAGTGKVTGADALNHPNDLAFDADGALVMANWHNQNIYRYARGLVDGAQRDQIAGLCDLECSDDSAGPTPVSQTQIGLPASIAIHPDGRIFFSESGCSRLRVLTVGTTRDVIQPPHCTKAVNLFPDGIIETLAGRSEANGYAGDGGPARDALFNIDNTPVFANFGIALSPEVPPRRLYVCDTKNHCVRYVDLTATPPTIHLFAGVPMQFGFEDGPALQARFNNPTYPTVHSDGCVYVADTRNHAIRRIDPDGRAVVTIAGTGQRGFNGDNLPPTGAQLNNPYGVAVHPDGRIFIADTDNHRIRVIYP